MAIFNQKWPKNGPKMALNGQNSQFFILIQYDYALRVSYYYKSRVVFPAAAAPSCSRLPYSYSTLPWLQICGSKYITLIAVLQF